MIFSGISLTDTILHQTGQRRQYVDRWINRLSVKLSVQNDLTFGDIPGQVRNRVGDIVVWHGQDRNLRNRPGAALYDTGTLIKGGQFTVEVTRITFTGRNLTLGGRYLSHRLTERSDIGEDDQNMHTFFKSQIFGGGQCHFRSDQSLNDRIICQVQIHDYVVRNTAFLEGTAEELSHVIFDTHRRKNDGEFFIGIVTKRSLLYDLCGKLVMGKTVSGENRKLLSADQSCQTVDGGDAGTDIVTRIFTGDRI